MDISTWRSEDLEVYRRTRIAEIEEHKGVFLQLYAVLSVSGDFPGPKMKKCLHEIPQI